MHRLQRNILRFKYLVLFKNVQGSLKLALLYWTSAHRLGVQLKEKMEHKEKGYYADSLRRRPEHCSTSVWIPGFGNRLRNSSARVRLADFSLFGDCSVRIVSNLILYAGISNLALCTLATALIEFKIFTLSLKLEVFSFFI